MLMKSGIVVKVKKCWHFNNLDPGLHLKSVIFFNDDGKKRLLEVSDSIDVHIGFGHFHFVFAG